MNRDGIPQLIKKIIWELSKINVPEPDLERVLLSVGNVAEPSKAIREIKNEMEIEEDVVNRVFQVVELSKGGKGIEYINIKTGFTVEQIKQIQARIKR